MNNSDGGTNISSPRVIPLSWVNEQLLPDHSLDISVSDVANSMSAEITILHTNDLHSFVDGRQNSAGEMRGGLARIATTIRRAREQGPTLVFDIGDLVFGLSTHWDILGAAPVARLRAQAGCDLATIGNHDLEHGLAGLEELAQGGYPFVSANLHVADPDTELYIRPAYLVYLASWRIGVVGLTTLSTFDLVPSRIMQGITLTEPQAELMRVVTALEPVVDTIVVLSHIGFYEEGGDPDLARHVAHSKVSLILGGHTHAALEPARVIAGITICSAGAYGANVGEVKLRRGNNGSIEVQTQLLPQLATIPGDPLWLAACAQTARIFELLSAALFSLPSLPEPVAVEWNRDREWIVLVRALRTLDTLPPATLLMLPRLYVIGQLPAGERATLAEIMSAYPNVEQLIAAEISGKILRELIALQSALLYYQQTRPLRLSDETEVRLEQVEEQGIYSIVTSELVYEGGLGWSPAKNKFLSIRSLHRTCLQIVQEYLSLQS